MNKVLSYKPFGEQAILIEWPQYISDQILEDLLRFKEGIQKEKSHFIADYIIGYHSLTLKYKTPILNYTAEVETLKSIEKKTTFSLGNSSVL